jgi:tetratricopeptide (TPR) repeat protein
MEGLVSSADLATRIGALQGRLDRVPGDHTAWSALGFAYVAQARATADASYYDRADQAFARSLQEQPDENAGALTGQGALANARHDFDAGKDLAEQAVEINAYDSNAKGVLVDALLELGEYDAGLETLQEMVDLRPGVPSLTRVSYSYELRGDPEGATYALDRALSMSAASPADASFALLLLGQLSWNAGDYEAAARHFGDGLSRDPSSVRLQAARAKNAASRGDVDAALQEYAEVVQALPEPAFLVEYAELLDSLGRPDEAREQYDVADAVSTLFDDAGVVPDIEVVLYDADHGRPEKALETAQTHYETRRSVQVEDALAWALYANGRYDEALEHAEAAQQLGTANALWDYHRGMIQAELGLVDEAVDSLTSALETNPGFSSLHAPRARVMLATLDG